MHITLPESENVELILLNGEKISLTIAVGNLTKTYDGTDAVDFTLDANMVTGLRDGDSISSLTLSSGNGTDVGGHLLTVSDVKVVDSNGNNVTFLYKTPTVDGTLTITPKPVTVTADNKEKTTAEPDPEFTATVNGLVGTDTADVITYAITRAGGNVAGTYVLMPSGEELQGNYQVTYFPGSLTIRIPVTVKADTKSKIFGADDNLTATVTGLAPEDTIDYSITRDPGEDVGEYTITPSGYEVQDKYFITYETGTLTINPRAVTVKANDLSKTYGNVDPISTLPKRMKAIRSP